MKAHSPLRQFLDSYADSARDPIDDLAAHLKLGYVVAADNLFVLARLVSRAAPEEEILCPRVYFERTDALFIWWCCGSLDDAYVALAAIVPDNGLKHIGWQRGGAGRIHWCFLDRLRRAILGENFQGKIV